MINRELGKYQVTERLGRGGMAEVYKAYHANLDRYVAIKVLHSFLADDPEFKERFHREAKHVALLRHPNIVQVYDFDFDPIGESFYMVMEFVDGLTLKERLVRQSEMGQPADFYDSLRIIREAAGALSYAHSRNMMHRDVKPANLMLDGDDRVVLTDFGIAKIVTGGHFTASGGMVGTPAYMAPEQGLGEAGDERSDLYSLGVILYQLLTGVLPYDAEAPLAIILQHLNEPIPSVLKLNPNYPPEVENLIQKLMAKDPEDRYQTANEVIDDLTRLEHGESLLNMQSVAYPPPVVTSGLDDTTTTITLPATDEVATPPATASRGGGTWIPTWLLGGIIGGIILIGSYFLGLSNGVFPPVIAALASSTPSDTATVTLTPTETALPTETATETVSPTVTETPFPSETPTATDTASPTPTSTPVPTETPTPTATDTLTPTNSPTVTNTPTITLTPTVTLTPTPDMTQTVFAATLVREEQTMTAEACNYGYLVVEESPPDGDYYTASTLYERQIVLLNSGRCAWDRNSSFRNVDGEDFDAPPIFIRERVEPGDELVLCLRGETPATGRVYTGTWELRTAGQVLIGEPFELSVSVFENVDRRVIRSCSN